jgi:hypothetical protein
MEAFLDGKSVLMFCATKNEVEAAAKQIGGYLHHCMSKDEENRRFPQLAQIIDLGVQKSAVEYFVSKTASKDETLQRCITYGVGWHHAGMAFCWCSVGGRLVNCRWVDFRTDSRGAGADRVPIPSRDDQGSVRHHNTILRSEYACPPCPDQDVCQGLRPTHSYYM